MTIASPITINVEGVPLKTSLYLALKQLNLGYRIKGGLLLMSEETKSFDVFEDSFLISALAWLPCWRRPSAACWPLSLSATPAKPKGKPGLLLSLAFQHRHHECRWLLAKGLHRGLQTAVPPRAQQHGYVG